MNKETNLEALRGAMGAIASARETLESEGAMVCAERLDDAHYVVEQALTELTARRALDAEVAALVLSAIDAKRRLRIALLPFQRSDDKGDAT